jgi:HAD superfamily hydrolase (TIGR01490 family)
MPTANRRPDGCGQVRGWGRRAQAVVPECWGAVRILGGVSDPAPPASRPTGPSQPSGISRPSRPGWPSGPRRTAAFLDLDKTIIAKSSVLAFGRTFYQSGLLNRRAVLRSAYAQFVFALAGADEDQIERMRAYLTAMCTGWDVAQVRDIVAETLHEIIDPIVYNEAVDLIAMHRAAGRDVVIVSSSGEEVVAPIGEMLGADHVIATQMVIAHGRYTGEISRYAYGPEKATAIRELADAMGYDLDACYAYSDSVTDVPMLEAVGHPFAVNPDRALRKIAVERAWPVLGFSNAVPLRERISGLRPPHPATTATVVGASVAAAGLLWYATRRRAARA